MRGQIKYRRQSDGTLKKVFFVNGEEVDGDTFNQAIPTKPIRFDRGELPGMHTDYGDWSAENDGRGRYCGQKAKFPGDPAGYSRSRDDLIEWGKTQGMTAEKD